MFSCAVHSSTGRNWRAQAFNGGQNGLKQPSRHCHFRHLEYDLPGMAHNLRPNLDQFFPQRRPGPVTNCLGQHRLTQKAARIIRQHEQLPPHLIIHQVVTGQAGPFDGVLSFLDPLLRHSCYPLRFFAVHGVGRLGSAGLLIFHRESNVEK